MTDIGDHEAFSADELSAAEYALGVLAGAERAAAAQRIARDRAFAALVAAWEERFAPWTAEIPEVAPPPQVWERIAAQLPGAERQGLRFWQSLVFWRSFALRFHRRQRRAHFCCRHRRQARGDCSGAGDLPG
jgi:anti-sigma-K factor RskA